MAKKIVTVGIRMDEDMLLKLKGMAEAEGMTESSLARRLISDYLDERAAYYAHLHSIFGSAPLLCKGNDAQQRIAQGAMSEIDDGDATE